MTDILVLILFVFSGAASGWLGVDLLPVDILKQVSNVEGFRIVLAIIGFFVGLAAGFVFLQLRKTFLDQIRTMPTDLLISRSVGLILGLLTLFSISNANAGGCGSHNEKKAEIECFSDDKKCIEAKEKESLYKVEA